MLGQGVARSTAIAAIAAGVSILVAAAQADVQSTQTTKIPPGAKWSQAYIKEKDGTILHADIERPAQLPASARTPQGRSALPLRWRACPSIRRPPRDRRPASTTS